jgi:hypothetical protein
MAEQFKQIRNGTFSKEEEMQMVVEPKILKKEDSEKHFVKEYEQTIQSTKPTMLPAIKKKRNEMKNDFDRNAALKSKKRRALNFQMNTRPVL